MPSSFSPALNGASSSRHRQIAPPPKVDRPLSLEAVADWLVLSNGARFGLDIGGTLCKLVCYEPHETWHMDDFLALVQRRSQGLLAAHPVGATGGGARKFRGQFEGIAGVQLERADELQCLVRGIDFLVRVAPGDCYGFAHVDALPRGAIQRPGGDSGLSASEALLSAAGLLPCPPIPAPSHPCPPIPAPSHPCPPIPAPSHPCPPIPAPSHPCPPIPAPSHPCPPIPAPSHPCPPIPAPSHPCPPIPAPSHPCPPIPAPSHPCPPIPAPSHPCPPIPAPSHPCTLPSLHPPIPAPSRLCTLPSLHPPIPALSHPCTLPSLHSPIPALSHPCTLPSLPSLPCLTFLGLAVALTGCTSFKEAMRLASRGDSTCVDMLVGDIYGGDYLEMGLAATTVASSLGKLVRPADKASPSRRPENLAKAVLLMVTNNIGSIAMLHARPAGVRHVLFTGSFMHNNKLAMRSLAVAMQFWSNGAMKT
ncbi:unnamed protein product [Closterium sp. Naga37s-1]|nr:unnamed protein product [Closterium sp. Naga37s-1]